MEENPCFLSIIVPVYNGERYLEECLNSLLDQDLPEHTYEIVCVNDGSKDGSAEILSRYQTCHQNLRVLFQQNSGVAAARNAGLDAARGEFIWFVDADDFIRKDCLQGLWDLAHSGDFDRIVLGGYEFVDALSPEEREQADRGALPCNTSYQSSVIWRNLLRREFLMEKRLCFRYPELTNGEDGVFLYEVDLQNPRTVETPQVLYFYRTHAGSAETAASLESQQKKIRSHIRVLEILLGYYENGHRDPATANKIAAFLWMSLYEIAQVPRDRAKPHLQKLRAMGLYPGKIPPECTQRQSYLTGTNSAAGKVLEFFCHHLHRPWAYQGMRLLRGVQRFLS